MIVEDERKRLMRIVTAGYGYLDIDAYAGCIAYAELLRAQGIAAKAASTAPFNESISKSVRSWNAPLDADYQASPEDTFTLIDISDPEHFDTFVAKDRIDEVIDHHAGFEQYWTEKIGEKAHIEFIGAACTLVYERWQASGLFDRISQTSARLLICGILDNTLNFGAKVTTRRDKEAYETLLTKAGLPDDWTARYFTECQEAILQDIVTALKSDMKVLTLKSFNHPVCVGQSAVWDSRQALRQCQDQIKSVLSGKKSHWFMNLMSISEGRSYFVTDNSEVQEWLANLFGVQFHNSVAAADRPWLRKEIIKRDLAWTPQSK